MTRLIMTALILTACAGCNTAAKKKSVSVEMDGAGKVIRRVETESIEQTDDTTSKLQFKYLQ
ncbi:MAG: hypothetical protein PHG96_01580 [Kiritimatiellae bacterium]|nr:hypothetical protein [Kiritimatiellia bacterium]MDD3544032.1 hypothetical protein [Kiritimatiellia bacterium]MDD4024303.1 hypothetical protein [Kiritimatiellia bacterium]MDD4623436.1 hypothetical protein [Kiritimatiellia bacterium]